MKLAMEQLYAAIPAPIKGTLDVAAVAGWVTVLAGMLTSLLGLAAAALSFAWAAIRLYETSTVQKWLAKRRSR